MSTLGPEARIAAQEALTTLLVARIEELAQNLANDFKDMTTRFKANADYLIEVERQLEARLDKIEQLSQDIQANFRELKQGIEGSYDNINEYFGHIEDDIKEVKATKEDSTKFEARLDKIEATMATKEDITAITATQDRQELLLQEILARLPAKPPESE